MNKGIYRLIFNKARGLLMVVGEFARSTSKSGVGGNRMDKIANRDAISSFIATLKPLSLALLFASGGISVSVSARIIADPSASGHQSPTVLTTANGLPQVNIQTPSTAGVSRNLYRQFDVNNRGAILNNSRTRTTTQLGGLVSANPHLATGTARVIVNEINSSNPSYLNGHIEIAGSRAEVVFANPAGISCSGCGFINAHQATLTTGEVLYQNGELDGYRVEQGTITIDGEGLDASTTDYTQIIARSVEVNASIWAQDLSVTTGTNTVDRDNQQITEHKPSQGQTPSYAIDVSALGGMYAGKIRLVGTENGVGVRNAGALGASVGDVIITADGHLENRHHISSMANTDIHTVSLDNSGVIYSTNNARLSTHEALTNSGTIAANQHTTLSAQGITQAANGIIAAGVNEDGTLVTSSTGRLQITATNAVSLSGDQIAQESLTVSAESIFLNHASQQASHIDLQASQLQVTQSAQQADSLSLAGGDNLDLSGSILTISDQLNLSTSQTLKTDDAKVTAGALSVTAGSHSNQSGVLQQTGNGTTDITVAQVINNTDGQLLSNGALSLTAQQLINQGGEVSNQGKTILALSGSLDSDNPSLNNGSGKITSGGELTLTSGAINNDQGLIQSAQSLTINTQRQHLANTYAGDDKGIVSGDKLILTIGTLDNDAGYIGSKEALVLTTTGSNSNRAGVIETQNSLSITSKVFDNNAGRLQSSGAFTIDTQGHTLTNTNSGDGGIISGNSLVLRTGDLNNHSGYISAADTTTLNTGAVTNTRGRIETAANLSISSDAFNNDQGLLLATQQLHLNTQNQTLINTNNLSDGGIVSRAGLLSLTTGSFDNKKGYIAGAESAVLTTADLDNREGQIKGERMLTIDADSLLNDSGTIDAVGDLRITSVGDIDNHQGRIISTKNTSLTSKALANVSGLVQSTETLFINTQGQTLTNTQSGTDRGIISGGTLSLITGDFDNRTGYVEASKAFTLNSADLTNIDGTILALARLNFTGTHLNNYQGDIQAGDNIAITATTLDNRQGLLRSNQRISVTAGTVNNSDTDATELDIRTGSITYLEGLQGETVTLETDKLDNTDGRIIVDFFTNASIDYVDNTRGLVQATNTLTLTDTHRDGARKISNSQGKFIAGKTLKVDHIKLSGSGEIFSHDAMDVDLSGDYTHTNDFIARNSLSFSLTGTLNNQAKLAATQVLDIDAHTINNSATGELSAASTLLTANTLNNRGLIDGSSTEIDVTALHNLGTGRIYGDKVIIEAETLSNHAENGKAAVIAARTELDIGARYLSNRDHSLIYSDGDLSIGRTVVGGQASGSGDTIVNDSATIEANGKLVINAARLDNLNPEFTTKLVETKRETVRAYSINTYSVRYDENTDPNKGEIAYRNNGAADDLFQAITPQGTSDNFIQYDFDRITTETTVDKSDPGKLISGSDMVLNIGTLVNDNSTITSGGILSGTANNLDNLDIAGERRIREEGTATHYYRRKKKGRDSQGVGHYNTYSGPENVTYDSSTISLVGESRVEKIVLKQDTDTGYNIQDKEIVDTGASTQRNHINDGTRKKSDLSDTQNRNREDHQEVDFQLANVTVVDVDDGSIRRSNRLTISNNSLFIQNPSPSANYLIETDARFTNERQWLSSDYVTQQLSQKPGTIQKRLGDGFYEQRLVHDQLVELTGRRFLDGYSDSETQYRALLDNGIAYAKKYNLSPGISLSQLQMQQLTTDIVWLEEDTVTLADGSTQQVLVPRLYTIVQANDLLPSGALISAKEINLDINQTLANSGAMVGREGVKLTAQRLQDTNGRVQAARITTDTTEDTKLEGSQWRATESMHITAGHDLQFRSQKQTTQGREGHDDHSYTGRLASLTVSGDSGTLSLEAKRDLNITAANISNTGSGDSQLIAGRNLTLDTHVEEQSYQHGSVSDRIRKEAVSSLNMGGNTTLKAKDTLSIRGADINSGQLLELEASDITVTATENSTHHQGQTSRSDYEVRTLNHQGANLTAGTDIRLTADNDINLEGSQLTADNTIALNAGGDTTISVVQDEDYRYSNEHKKKSFGRSKSTINESFTTSNVGGQLTAGNNLSINSHIDAEGGVGTQESGHVVITGGQLSANNQLSISGDGVTIRDKKEVNYSRKETHKSGFARLSKSSKGKIDRKEIVKASEVTSNNDIGLLSTDNAMIIGSNINARGDINIQAEGDVLVAASLAKEESQQWSKSSNSLRSMDSLYEKEEDISGSITKTVVASQVSADGSINIDAGRAKVVGSDILAENAINVTSDIGDIEIISAESTTESYSKSVKVKVGLTDVLEQSLNTDKLIDDLANSEAKITLAKAKYDSVDSKTSSTTHRASSLTAKGDISLDSVGDISLTGSDVVAKGDTHLTAGGNITIRESVDTTDKQTKETHGKAEMSLVVKHQAVEVAKAIEAVNTAKDQLKKAKEDYRKYQKDLAKLESRRDQLLEDYNNQVAGVLYDDITELNHLIEEAESDKEWHLVGITLAATNLTSKTTLLTQQTAAAAQSASTWGFNAGIQMDLEASKSQTETHTETSRGSTLAGHTITIKTGHNGDTEKTTTRISGSHLQGEQDINIATGELIIKASKDNNSSTTKTEEAHIQVVQTLHGTGGPNISGDFSRSRAKNNSTTYNHSTLDAKNINLSSTEDTIIRGANIKADGGQLNVDAGKGLIVESSQNRTVSNNKGLGFSGGFGLSDNQVSSVKGSVNNSHGRSQTIKNNNSTLEAKNIRLSSGGDTTIKGANINADGGLLKVDVGANLIVQSRQDRTTGRESSKKVDSGLGLSGDKVSSVKGGFSTSSGSNYSRETVLTELSGESIDITVGQHTSLVGASISAKDADGKDNAQLSLRTQSFDYVDLNNTSHSNQKSTSASSSMEISRNNTKYDTQLKVNTTKVAHNNSSHYEAGKTLATLGQGSVVIGDDQQHSGNNLAGLNRDIEKTEKELYRIDRQQSIDLTIDTRILTENGRKQIKEDVKRTKIAVDAIVDLAEGSVSLTGKGVGETSFRQHLMDSQDYFTATKNFSSNPNNAQYVAALTSGDATPEEKQLAYTALANSIANQLNVKPTKAMLLVQQKYNLNTRPNTLEQQATIRGGYSREVDKIFIVDNNNKTVGDTINTLGNELSHHVDHMRDGDAAFVNTEMYRDKRDNYSDIIGNATEDYVGFNFSANGYDSLTASNNQVGSYNIDGSINAALQKNNTAFKQLDQSQVEYRQLHALEAGLIKETAQSFAQDKGIAYEEALGRLKTQAMRQIDSNHDDGLHDGDAATWLDNLSTAYLRNDQVDHENADSKDAYIQLFTATEKQRNDHDLFADNSLQVNDILYQSAPEDTTYTTAFIEADTPTEMGWLGLKDSYTPEELQALRLGAVSRGQLAEIANNGSGDVVLGYPDIYGNLRLPTAEMRDNNASQLAKNGIFVNPADLSMAGQGQFDDGFALDKAGIVQYFGLSTKRMKSDSNDTLLGISNSGHQDIFKETIRYVTLDSSTPTLLINNGNINNIPALNKETDYELGGYTRDAQRQQIAAAIQESSPGEMINLSKVMEQNTAITYANNSNWLTGFSEDLQDRRQSSPKTMGFSALASSMYVPLAEQMGRDWEITFSEDKAPAYIDNAAKAGVAMEATSFIATDRLLLGRLRGPGIGSSLTTKQQKEFHKAKNDLAKAKFQYNHLSFSEEAKIKNSLKVAHYDKKIKDITGNTMDQLKEIRKAEKNISREKFKYNYLSITEKQKLENALNVGYYEEKVRVMTGKPKVSSSQEGVSLLSSDKPNLYDGFLDLKEKYNESATAEKVKKGITFVKKPIVQLNKTAVYIKKPIKNMGEKLGETILDAAPKLPKSKRTYDITKDYEQWDLNTLLKKQEEAKKEYKNITLDEKHQQILEEDIRMHAEDVREKRTNVKSKNRAIQVLMETLRGITTGSGN